MSHWNYRVIYNGCSYQIYEVYYDNNDKPTSWLESPGSPYGESLDELKEDFLLMAKAFERPALLLVKNNDEEELIESSQVVGKL